MASFDWYQATVRVPVDDLIEGLFDLDDHIELKHTKGAQAYAHTTSLIGSQGRIGHVWHGGSHEHPHVVISGEDAQAGAELIRARFPDHSVTRADAREDFSDEGAFDRLTPHLLDVADRFRVKVDTRGDHLLTKDGRTVYLGAPSSATRFRMYDKAAEMRAKFAADPVRLAAVPQTLTRLEAQVRPQTRKAKRDFATIEPLQVMGSSRWLADLWRLVAGLELQPLQVGKGYRQSDDDRAWAYLLAQYGGLLARKQAELGDWACVGLQIGTDLAERAKVRRYR
jgi:hypothetical protein